MGRFLDFKSSLVFPGKKLFCLLYAILGLSDRVGTPRTFLGLSYLSLSFLFSSLVRLDVCKRHSLKANSLFLWLLKIFWTPLPKTYPEKNTLTGYPITNGHPSKDRHTSYVIHAHWSGYTYIFRKTSTVKEKEVILKESKKEYIVDFGGREGKGKEKWCNYILKI